MAERRLDVQALALRSKEDDARDRVHGQARERDDQHPAAEDLGRVPEALDRLPDDPAADEHERQPVDEGGEDLCPLEAEASAWGGRARGERQRDEREADRERVGQHVPRIRQHGKASREEAGDDLYDGEADRQCEHDRERAAGGASVVVGGAAGVVPVVAHKRRIGAVHADVRGASCCQY
jgi:hypothetical protein